MRPALKNWSALTPSERIARVEVWREQTAQFGDADRNLLADVARAEKRRETRLRAQRARFARYRRALS